MSAPSKTEISELVGDGGRRVGGGVGECGGTGGGVAMKLTLIPAAGAP